jgi:outer membrane receptor for ferrienterochelin and colicin
MRRLLTGAARAFAALVAVVAPLAAQTSQTAGAIRGRVATPAGAPIAGVTVAAVSDETGLRRVATSDAQGIYVIRLLPSGVYTVQGRRLGYAATQVQGVRVTVGATTTANLALRDAAQQLTTVTVGADRPRIDVADGGVKQTVTTEEIQNLPTLGRDFTDFIALSGLVSPVPEATTGGQFSIAGARPSETSIQIDGVDGNNAFFGGNRGGARTPFNFSLESVKEFQIVTNGFDVEYGNYSGGVINILTKGGTNRTQATFYSNYRGDNLTASNFDGTQPRNFEAIQYAGALSGALVKDRLFYSVTLDGQRRREPFVPNSPQVFRDRAAAATGAEATRFSAIADSLARFQSILANTYGITGAESNFRPFETTNDVLTIFARLDWNVSDRHRFSLRNNFSTFDNLNEAGGASVTGGLSRAEAFRNRNNGLVAELTSQVGSTASNVFRVQWSRESQPRSGNELRPALLVQNIATGIGNGDFGGQGISFRNLLEEDKLQIIDNFSVQKGRHGLKFGTNLIFSRFTNIFWQGGSGTWTFNSLADLEARRPLSYTRNLRGDLQPPAAFFDQQELAFYAQDDWQLSRKLLVQAGLRYDLTRFTNVPGRVQDVERAFGFGTGIAPVDNNNISPRLSATYDLRGDGREVLRAGGGLFYGRFPAVLGSNVGITDLPLLTLNCSGSLADGAPNAPPVPANYATLAPDGSQNPTSCLAGGVPTGTPNYAAWNAGFRLPETWKANVGYERLLGQTVRFSADLIWSQSNHLYTVRNLNLRDPQFELANEGGRRVFTPAAQFNPSNRAANFDNSRRFTEFGDVFVNTTDGRARSLSATFNVEKRFARRGGILRASYTYANAEDNSSYNCCTAFEGFSDPRIGAFGPNEIGGAGDRARGWGTSQWVRNHAVVVSGFVRAPWGFTVSAFWRMQSGRPWGPEQTQDLNGDGVNFNDRPFIFNPDSLPVFVAPAITGPGRAPSIVATRTRYREHLNAFECVRSFVGRIVDRNTCREDWFNRLDLSIRKDLGIGGGRAQLSIDLFNVLNGLNSDWGRFVGVRGAARNLVQPQSYDAGTGQILYSVPAQFGREATIGTNLLLQFSTQVGIRYSF